MTALYDVTITHVRSAPLRNAFRYGSYLRLVELPPEETGFLEAYGLRADRVVRLAGPRVLGYAFDPLTVYWCHLAGVLVCTVAEVRNTYGGRHRYLLMPGQNEVEKVFYVSPFNEVSGFYRLALPLPGERLALGVTLHREGHPPFVATVRGERVEATAWGRLRMALKHPLAPFLVSARIRRQGIALYLRGLKVVPRRRSR
ncbi:DUF1365 domain-containing protein [Nonomuraea sp. NPDC050556]|uniref:DUF1365 domain-containing protein n=1 Tax=Nonomuraea sp. NPDC050556 TaxID=3364369 RepID=UPI0037AAB798